MSHERKLDCFVVGFLLLLPLLLFADVLVTDRALYEGDLSAYQYPLRTLYRDALRDGELPLWTNALAGGQPMAANAAHAVFYPPMLLLLLPSYHVGFHLLIVLHFMLAATGMFALLRSLGISRTSSALIAMAFCCSGLLFAATLVLTILWNIAWMPWVLFFAHRFAATRRRPYFAGAAAAFALQLLLGEPTHAAQTALLLGCGALALRPRLRHLGIAVAITITAALLAAVQLMPLLDHLRDTDRGRGYAFDLVRLRSMPPIRIAELFVPRPLGDWVAAEHSFWGYGLYPGSYPFYASIYAGMLVGALCVAGLVARVRGRWLFAGVSLLSVALAAGDHMPLLRLLHAAGIAKLIRYPEKFITMGVIAALVFAAAVLDALLQRERRVVRALLVTVTAFGIASAMVSLLPGSALAGHLLAMRDRMPDAMAAAFREAAWNHTLRAALLLAAIAVALRVRPPLRIALFAAFVLADTLTVSMPVLPRIDRAFYDEPRVTRSLPEREQYRLFPFHMWLEKTPVAKAYDLLHPDAPWVARNRLSGYTAIAHGTQLVLENDYDGTRLAVSADLTRAAIALMRSGNREWIDIVAAMTNSRFVTLWRKPQTALAQARGDVRGIEPLRLVEGPRYPRYYFASRLVPLVTRADFAARLQRERFPRDVAFVDGRAFAPARARVLSVRERRNGATIDVEADGASFLVMSVTSHRYWSIRIDGRRAEPVRTNLAFQGVPVPAGRHSIEMRHENPMIIAGAAISLLTAIAVLIGTMRPL